MLQSPSAPFAADAAEHDLKKVIETVIFPEINATRSATISGVEKRNHYWRGNQHLVLEGGGSSYRWVPVQESSRLRDMLDSENTRVYDYTINHYKGDGSKFIAVIGQRAPNVKAAPDRTGDDELEELCPKADTLATIFRAAWDVSAKQKLMAFNQWNTTTCFHYVYWNADRRKYGVTRVPKIRFEEKEVSPGGFLCLYCKTFNEEQAAIASEVCQNCQQPLQPETYVPPEIAPVPIEDGFEEYDNGMVELRVCDITTVTVPEDAEDIDSCAWLRYEFRMDSSKLAEIYPQLLPKVGTQWGGEWGGGDNAQQARERINSFEPTGHRRSVNKWLFTQFWLQPHAYANVKDEKRRAELMQRYPNGIRLVYVNGELMEAVEESVADHWKECKPTVSTSILADPIGKDMLPGCDAMNDMLNYNIAAAERMNPITIADPRILDPEQYKNKRGMPGDIYFSLPSAGSSFGEGFYKMPVAEMSQEANAFSGLILEANREVTGVLRPIFGGDSGSQTAHEAEQKRVQALMQLSLAYDYIRGCWERTYLNAMRLFGKMARGGVKMRGVALTPEEVSEFSELADAAIHFESDEGFPMTWAQQSARVMSLIDKGPDAWGLLGVGDPDNKQNLVKAAGLPDWKIPYRDDTNKIRSMIKRLLKEQPIMGPMGLEPSIPPDEFEDDHPFVADFVRQWAQKKEVVDPETGIRWTNQAGYANVIAWGRAHKMIADMMAMQAAPPPGDGPGQPSAPPVPGDGGMPPGGLMAEQEAGLSSPPPGQQSGQPALA